MNACKRGQYFYMTLRQIPKSGLLSYRPVTGIGIGQHTPHHNLSIVEIKHKIINKRTHTHV